jgi:hypothetical protein
LRICPLLRLLSLNFPEDFLAMLPLILNKGYLLNFPYTERPQITNIIS